MTILLFKEGGLPFVFMLYVKRLTRVVPYLRFPLELEASN